LLVSLRKKYTKYEHELPGSGHPGIGGTIERITRTFYFPGVKRTVEGVIREYTEYAVNKITRHKPHRQIQAVGSDPKTAWQSVAIDFIVKLPLSKEPIIGIEFDSIIVVTDRLTKRAYFILVKESMTAEELAYVFFRHI